MDEYRVCEDEVVVCSIHVGIVAFNLPMCIVPCSYRDCSALMVLKALRGRRETLQPWETGDPAAGVVHKDSQYVTRPFKYMVNHLLSFSCHFCRRTISLYLYSVNKGPLIHPKA